MLCSLYVTKKRIESNRLNSIQKEGENSINTVAATKWLFCKTGLSAWKKGMKYKRNLRDRLHTTLIKNCTFLASTRDHPYDF